VSIRRSRTPKVKSIELVRQWPAVLAEGVLSERWPREVLLRKFADGTDELSVHEDGKVYDLRCSPGAKRPSCASCVASLGGDYVDLRWHREGESRTKLGRRCEFRRRCGDQRLWRAQRSCVQGRQEKRRGADSLGPAGKLLDDNLGSRIRTARRSSTRTTARRSRKEMLWKAGELNN